jgi:hypothetical protein
MELINSNDLIASGIAFSIVDTEVSFGDDGELSGYTEVIDETYRPCDGRYTPEREYLVNTTELLDDTTGRWEHERDAYLADMLHHQRLSRPHRGDEALDYGAMQHWALCRERRVANLIGYMRKLAICAKRHPAQVRAIVRTMQQGIRARYIASIQLIVQRDSDEWWLLYITKAQYQYLMRCVRRLRSLC